MTSCPSEERMSRRMRRDIAESSTIIIFGTGYLQNGVCHSVQGNHSIDEIGFDDGSWHTIYHACCFRFAEDQTTTGFDPGAAIAAVITHTGHHDPQNTFTESLSGGAE